MRRDFRSTLLSVEKGLVKISGQTTGETRDGAVGQGKEDSRLT